MRIDLLARKEGQFVLWHPGATDPAPALAIGTVQDGTIADLREIPLAPADGHPDLWQVAAADCALADGQVYHYWFKIRDTNVYNEEHRILYCTDPTATTVDRRFPAPSPQDEEGVASRQPAGVVLYRDGMLIPCDPGGQTVGWEGDAAADDLPSNDRLVIYELPTRWSRAADAGGIQVGNGTFRDVIGLLTPAADDPAVALPAIEQGHLLDLGVNALELLPPADSDDVLKWGYGTANFFAAAFHLGLPPGQEAPTASTDLAALILACHRSGIRFFCDMVMAFARDVPYRQVNFGDFLVQASVGDPEEAGREGFGGDLFKYNYATESYHPLSGTRERMVPAREYMKAYMAHWMSYYRLDGLRLDSVNNIGCPDFLQEFTALARQLWRDRGGSDDRFLTVGEELSVPLSLVEENRVDGMWNEHFKQIVRRVILGQSWDGAADFEESVRTLIDCRQLGFRDGTQAINYITSHDIGGYGNERLYNYLDNNGIARKEERILLAFACLLTAVGIPMILAGEEFADQQDLDLAQPDRGDTYKQIDPVHFDRLGDEWRRDIFTAVARLVRLRTGSAALAMNDTAFIHSDFTDGKRAIAWQRGRGNELVLVVANFSDYATPNPDNLEAAYVVAGWPETPPGKGWHEVLTDRAIPPEQAGKEPIGPWDAKVYALVDRP